jgi:hypothetical protein
MSFLSRRKPSSIGFLTSGQPSEDNILRRSREFTHYGVHNIMGIMLSSGLCRVPAVSLGRSGWLRWPA